MELTELWGRAVGWILSLHRDVYLDLGVHMRALAAGSPALVAAAVMAFLLGLLHALTPGHGKSVVFAYFLGRQAHPLSGMALGLRIAALHVALGGLLFLVLQGAVAASGASGGTAGRALRLASHAAVALVGLWLLLRAVHGAPPDATARPGMLSLAVGLLPCPMTLFLLGYAAANATLATGLILVGVMALGIAATLGSIGVAAILARQWLAAWLGDDGARFAAATRPLAVASAAIIACIGAGAFVLELLSRRAGPFG